MLSTGLLKLRSVCARGVKGVQSGILGRIGVSCVVVWECGSVGGVYRRIGRIGLRATLTFLSLTGGVGRVYRRIGLRATLTFLSLTGGQNRQNFLGASRRNDP